MFHQLINIPKNRSCFLFGARGTGKSTLLREAFPPGTTRIYNLLEAETEDRLSRDPQVLEREVLALTPETTHVVLDEVQKVPRLLNAVHNLIETHRVPQTFILTGSITRKLKSGSTNLLAGRASLRHLFPLSLRELGTRSTWTGPWSSGACRKSGTCHTDEDRGGLLRAYAHGYLREEIRAEQVVRRLDPFRRFLEVAAQDSGKILNHTRIARDTGSDPKTVQAWYGVLEDTLMGFLVDGYHSSVRKQLARRPSSTCST